MHACADMSRNKLSAVPVELNSMVDLERIACAHNLIILIPDLPRLTSLAALDVRCAAVHDAVNG